MSLQAVHWRATFENKGTKRSWGGDRDVDWGLGSSRKHSRETQEQSLGERGWGKKEMWQTLEEKWNNGELNIVSWPALSAEGWGDFTQGLGHLCWPWYLWEGTGWTPSHQIGHLGLEQGVLVATGQGRVCPTGVMSGDEFVLFSWNLRAVSISCNRRSLTSGVVFHFSCLMWHLWLSLHGQKLGWGQNQTILVSNSFGSLLSIPAEERGSDLFKLLFLCFSVWQTSYWSLLPANAKRTKRGKKKKNGKWGSEVAQCCYFAVEFVIVQFPFRELWGITKLIILTGIFSAVFPAECECLFSCRQMDRACRITFTGEKPALKSFDSRHGIWSISIEMSSLSFIFCQMPISS